MEVANKIFLYKIRYRRSCLLSASVAQWVINLGKCIVIKGLLTENCIRREKVPLIF